MDKKQFFKIYLLQIFTTIFGMSVISYLLLFYQKNGVSFIYLVVGELLMYSVAVGIYLFKRKFYVRKNFYIIIAINLILVAIVTSAQNQFSFWPVQLLRGCFLVYFWVPFNTIYFALSSKNRKASHAVWMTIVGPVIGSFVPLLSGLIISYTNYSVMFFLGAVINAFTFFIIRRIPDQKYEFSLSKSLKKLNKIKTLLFFEGVMHTIFISLIPLMSLKYIDQEKQWGIFISYLGLMGAVVAIFLTFTSDKYKIRKGFIVPLSIILAFGIMSLSLANSLWTWGVLTGLFYIVFSLFNPFCLTLVLDTAKNNFDCWAGREFILNTGRSIVMMLAVICAVTNNFNYIFIIVGLFFLLYPIILFKKKIYV